MVMAAILVGTITILEIVHFPAQGMLQMKF